MRVFHQVMDGFGLVRVASKTVALPKYVKFTTAPGEDFMHVGLVPRVKYDLVHRRVKHSVQSHSQLNDTQVGADMATSLGDLLNQEFADLTR